MKKKICIASRLIHALILTAGFAATAFGQTDFGEPVNGPLAGQVLAIAVDRNDVFFAGTSSGVGRSTNNGDSWSVDLPGIPVFALAINNAGHIFAGTLVNGVYRSIDQGDTWYAVKDGLTNSAIFALSINSAQHLFAGTFAGGVFRSIDNGSYRPRTTHHRLMRIADVDQPRTSFDRKRGRKGYVARRDVMCNCPVNTSTGTLNA